jgi:hypothetical protein
MRAASAGWKQAPIDGREKERLVARLPFLERIKRSYSFGNGSPGHGSIG